MYLYKFSDIEVKRLASLHANMIWFSSLKDCNDPFEATHNFIEDDNHEETTKNIKKPASFVLGNQDFDFDLIKIEKKSKEEIKEVTQRGSLSMSLHCDKRQPHINNLMWSHYADGMKGFCLKFNKEKFIGSIYGDHKINLIKDIYFRPVEYKKSPPHTSWKTIKNNHQIIFNKSDHWEYENECRLTSTMIGNHSYDPKSLEEIIIGYKMPPAIQLMVASIVEASSPSAILKEAIIEQGSYEIKIIDFDKNEKAKKLNELSHNQSKIIKESAFELLNKFFKTQ